MINKYFFLTFLNFLILNCSDSKVFNIQGTQTELLSVKCFFTPTIQNALTPFDELVKLINNAKEEIMVQSYAFSSDKIFKALLRAKNRNVVVKILFSPNILNDLNYAIKDLVKKGLIIYIDTLSNGGLAHNKIMIIDSKIVFTGSGNFTRAAEQFNLENFVQINSREIAEIYRKNFEERFNLSRKLSEEELDKIKNYKNEKDEKASKSVNVKHPKPQMTDPSSKHSSKYRNREEVVQTLANHTEPSKQYKDMSSTFHAPPTSFAFPPPLKEELEALPSSESPAPNENKRQRIKSRDKSFNLQEGRRKKQPQAESASFGDVDGNDGTVAEEDYEDDDEFEDDGDAAAEKR